MRGKRSYGDSCGIARALDIVGERWALLVVRELILGPKRFTDLRAALPGVSPDMLAQRLRDLQGAGIVAHVRLAPPAASSVYELTERGRGLEDVLLALGRWGSRTPLPPDPPPLSVDALALALKTTFDPRRARRVRGCWQLRLGEDSLAIRVDDGELHLWRGAATAPAATLYAHTGPLAAALWHGRPVEDAEDAGALRIEGDRRSARRLLGLFRAPEGSRGDV